MKLESFSNFNLSIYNLSYIYKEEFFKEKIALPSLNEMF